MPKLRLVLRQERDKVIRREPTHLAGLPDPVTGVSDSHNEAIQDIDPEGSVLDLVPEDRPSSLPDTPDDPYKPAIRRGRPRRWLARLIYDLLHRQRPLDAEEQAKAKEQQDLKKLERLLIGEANLFMDRIRDALDTRGLCYRYPKSERDIVGRGKSSVKFKRVMYSAEAIWLGIDLIHRPRGVGVLQLMDPDILTDLSLTCGRKITGEYSEEKGAWYVVERATGVRGIPVHVPYQDMMESWPSTADNLTIPLGMGPNRRRIYKSLKEFPHLLIAGTTDSGKSNMMNVIIGTLISKNSPDELRLILVDLKGGMEMTFYEGVPHLLPIEGISPKGIVYERDTVPDALEWLIQEGEKRMMLIKNAGHKNITKYNTNRRHNRLPRIVLVIDELADVRLVKAIAGRVEDALSNLAARMRAVGIHVICATQVPKREVISTIIKSNLPAKMAFSCPTYTASELILDNGDAKGLAPQGRFIFQRGEQLTIQAPYMPDALIHDIVQSIMAGQAVTLQARHDVSIEEVLAYGLDQRGGALSTAQIYETFKHRGLTVAEVKKWLAEIEGKIVQVRENNYLILSGSGSAPRKMKLVEGDNVSGSDDV